MPIEVGKKNHRETSAEAPPKLPGKDAKKNRTPNQLPGEQQGRQISSNPPVDADLPKGGSSAAEEISQLAEHAFTALPPAASTALALSSSQEHPASLVRSKSPRDMSIPNGKEQVTAVVSKVAEEVFTVRTPVVDPFYEQFNSEMLPICRISTLLALVMRGVMMEGKMYNRGHYFAPDRLSEEKEKSYGGYGKYLPDAITRKVIDGKRSDLFFFRYCIHYLRTLYPDERNEKMCDIWRAVKTGIEKLKLEYLTESGIKITEDIALRWKMHEWEPKWTPEMTYGQMFNAWQQTVEGYVNNVGLGNASVQHEGPSEAFIDVIENISLISDNEKVKNEAAALLIERTKKFSRTVLSGSIPTNLDPIADKIRNFWTMDKIHKMVKTIDKIGKCPEPFEKLARLKYLAEKLDKRALVYTEMISDNLNRLLSTY